MSTSNLFSVSGKKAIVTGGTSGIGRACATALAMAGADVAIAARNAQLGNMVVESLEKKGVKSFFVECDVSDERMVTAMLKKVSERFGRIDIGVNSAGIATKSKGLSQSKKEWDSVIDVNLTGLWMCSRAISQQMIEQRPMGGKLINIASVAAKTASDNPAYCASKAGVVHLTRALAMCLGAYNINVNSISPGVVMTPLVASYSEILLNRIKEITPLGYIGSVQDIYGAILFLASSASDFVTGHDLILDGGRTLSTWIEPIPRSTPPRSNRAD